MLNKRNWSYYFASYKVRLALGYIIFLLVVAVFADLLAHQEYGILSSFGPNNIGESNNIFKEPGFQDVLKGSERLHHLGTDGRGRDVLSILIHGTRTSLLLGFFSALIAVFLGSIFGLLAAYFGNYYLKFGWTSLIFLIVSVILLVFYAIECAWVSGDHSLRFDLLRFGIVLFIGVGVILFILRLLNRMGRNSLNLPVDDMVMRFTEVFRAVPALFLLLSIIAFIQSQTLVSTTILIGLLGWPSILRIVRGEVMNIRESDFIRSAGLMGMSHYKILANHIIPNILPVLIVYTAFLISTNILLESTLSFLGLGLPADQPSWGGLLKQSREDFGAWWIALFPGLAITLTLFSLNILAERYNKLMKKAI